MQQQLQRDLAQFLAQLSAQMMLSAEFSSLTSQRHLVHSQSLRRAQSLAHS
jgi:hypothetical protein